MPPFGWGGVDPGADDRDVITCGPRTACRSAAADAIPESPNMTSVAGGERPRLAAPSGLRRRVSDANTGRQLAAEKHGHRMNECCRGYRGATRVCG